MAAFDTTTAPDESCLMVSDTPQELIDMITAQMSVKDIANLSQTSSHMHKAVMRAMLAADRGAKALFHGAQHGFPTLVVNAIDAGASIDHLHFDPSAGMRTVSTAIVSVPKTSALATSIIHGHPEVALKLLEKGANPNSRSGLYTCAGGQEAFPVNILMDTMTRCSITEVDELMSLLEAMVQRDGACMTVSRPRGRRRAVSALAQSLHPNIPASITQMLLDAGASKQGSQRYMLSTRDRVRLEDLIDHQDTSSCEKARILFG